MAPPPCPDDVDDQREKSNKNAPSSSSAVLLSSNDSSGSGSSSSSNVVDVGKNASTTVTKTTTTTSATVVVHPPHAPPYIRCESLEPFVGCHHRAAAAAAAEFNNGETGGEKQVKQPEQLNLNLGQKWITPKNKRLLWMIRFLSFVLVEWWERFFYKLWQDVVPLSWKRQFVFGAWKIYLPLHKWLLGNRTAIHRDASLEYHALSTLMYWGRFIPVSVQRMRFTLSQLDVWTRTPMTAARVTKIVQVVTMPPLAECTTTTPATTTATTTTATTKTMSSPSTGSIDATLSSITTNNTVRGIFLHRHTDRATDCTIFWIYGGAFLSGDAPGNSAIADWVGNVTNMDVFIPTIRLAPEANMDEIVWDVCLAYSWLCRHLKQQEQQEEEEAQQQQGQPAVAGGSKRRRRTIQLLGISSGGALCTRLMQLIAEHERQEDIVPVQVEPLLASTMQMPIGAVLLGPFADYTPAKGSLLEYAKHDLVVHDRVLESGLPYLETHIPQGRRYEYSPALRSCQGLPPLCVVLSMHEAVYDMTVTLINRARSDGVPVTVGCWKYMCHVFSFLQAFIPEGRVSMEFLAEWMRQRNAQVEEEAASASLATTAAETVGKDSN